MQHKSCSLISIDLLLFTEHLYYIAKLANHAAKKWTKTNGVVDLSDQSRQRICARINQLCIVTALQLARVHHALIRKNFSVVPERTARTQRRILHTARGDAACKAADRSSPFALLANASPQRWPCRKRSVRHTRSREAQERAPVLPARWHIYPHLAAREI